MAQISLRMFSGDPGQISSSTLHLRVAAGHVLYTILAGHPRPGICLSVYNIVSFCTHLFNQHSTARISTTNDNWDLTSSWGWGPTSTGAIIQGPSVSHWLPGARYHTPFHTPWKQQKIGRKGWRRPVDSGEWHQTRQLRDGKRAAMKATELVSVAVQASYHRHQGQRKQSDKKPQDLRATTSALFLEGLEGGELEPGGVQ